MTEKYKNTLEQSVSQNSEKQKNITKTEWEKIKLQKEQLFAKVSNIQKKEKLQKIYNKLNKEFIKYGNQIHNTTGEELAILKEIFKLENKEQIQNINILAKYFNITDTSKLEQISAKLLKAGLKPASFLEKYKKEIESKLLGLSSIPNGDEYLEKIKTSIGKRFLTIDDSLNNLKTKISDGKTIYDYKWDINDIIQEKFNFINTELFPSVQFLIKEGGKIKGNTSYTKYILLDGKKRR